ncbi:MAG: hypothetical protein ACO1OO_15620 [Flavisolibacter sp.]
MPFLPTFGLAAALFLAAPLWAQTSVAKAGCQPPKSRELWHDYIDKEQRNALMASGNSTHFASDNETVSYYVTKAITEKVDSLQCRIEADSLGDQKKVGYLRGVERLLKNFVYEYRNNHFSPSSLPAAIDAYVKAMEMDKKGERIDGFVNHLNYEVAKLVVETGPAFERNKGYNRAEDLVVKKYLSLHPDRIFTTLTRTMREDPEFPYIDSLILIAGYKNPRKLYDYAAANNPLGRRIRRLQDPLVKTVAEMATDPNGSGQMYFPFLDNILKGTQTKAAIDEAVKDPVKYYKLLVKTKMEYVQRNLSDETILEMRSLNAMLEKKGVETFIKVINDLHESPDPVRFRILNQLTAEELYFLVISGERDLYTSSYTRGVYPIMMQKIGNKGDSLLMNVGFSHFKKFIKIAAGYNTLSHFLSSMPKEYSNTLMTAFVNGLEESKGLEDGVDVADSYASIMENIKPVADEMLANVQRNLERNRKANNKRGVVIYDLLQKLFLSSTDSSIDLSKEFHIPPVYGVNYKTLEDEKTGAVVMQVFFYGDEDGRYNYAHFVPEFPSSAWKREETKYWVKFTSTKGKPVMVFANKPLPEETGEVDKAQAAVSEYIEQQGLHPTIVVHRGHSYYAPYTIEQLPSSAKIVFLGSCGGYHLIHDVLAHASDAHIIASKQTGRQVINQPFFDLLNDKMISGSNIDWIPFWKEFEKLSGKQEGFGDYIPPHKNLGAIFIKAYKNAMGESGDDDEGDTL